MSTVRVDFTRRVGVAASLGQHLLNAGLGADDEPDDEEELGWGQFAACLGKPVEWFYPQRGKAGEAEQVAATICRVCPVQYPCLQAGMPEEHGMWGGWAAELRWWYRVRVKACVWCETTIPDYDTRLFCDDRCVAEAVIATGEAAYRVRSVLDDMIRQARLGIAQKRGRRLAEPSPEPMAVAGG